MTLIRGMIIVLSSNIPNRGIVEGYLGNKFRKVRYVK